MIGYGAQDTVVHSIDRRSSDGLIGAALTTSDPTLLTGLTTTKDYIAFLVFDPEISSGNYNTYRWFKIVQDAVADTNDF